MFDEKKNKCQINVAGSSIYVSFRILVNRFSYGICTLACYASSQPRNRENNYACRGSLNSCWKNSKNFHKRKTAQEGKRRRSCLRRSRPRSISVVDVARFIFLKTLASKWAFHRARLAETSARCRVLFGYENSEVASPL